MLTERELRKARHNEIHTKLNVVKEYQRAGKRHEIPEVEEIPIVQIATSTLKNKNSKAERLKYAIYSKNR